MESYILRIYRRKAREARILVGTVEEVGKDEKKSFRSSAELCEILDSKGKPPTAPKRERRSPSSIPG